MASVQPAPEVRRRVGWLSTPSRATWHSPWAARKSPPTRRSMIRVVSPAFPGRRRSGGSWGHRRILRVSGRRCCSWRAWCGRCPAGQPRCWRGWRRGARRSPRRWPGRGPAEGTVRFGLDGTEYEIDLSAQRARALRGALARYVAAARREPGTRRPTPRARKASASGLNSTQNRDWARGQGIEVRDRSRIPAELVIKFTAATGQ